jgi:hypothetical protein
VYVPRALYNSKPEGGMAQNLDKEAVGDPLVRDVQQLVGGLIGLILAMLMETVLLIIRTTVSPRSKAEEILLRHNREMQEAKLQKEQAREKDQNGADDQPEEASYGAGEPASNSNVKKDQ